MTDQIPDAPPAPEIDLAMEILEVCRKHSQRSGIDPLEREDATQLPLGTPYLIATKAAQDYLEWARKHRPDGA
jgi:hypothetical protein